MAEIFTLLDDKDIFAKFTSHRLAVRLTSKMSASDDAERSFIEKMAVGHAKETANLKGMLKVRKWRDLELYIQIKESIAHLYLYIELFLNIRIMKIRKN